MLHIIKSANAVAEALPLVGEGDEILLIEDAVYASIAKHQAFGLLRSVQVNALIPDLAARGISNRVSPSVNLVDYSGFVALTATHSSSLTWD